MSDEFGDATRVDDPRFALLARLREAREAVGLSVQDISDRSRISISVLSSFEAGDFSIVEPNYVRGHLRAYARIVGVPLQEVDEILPPAKPIFTAESHLEDDEATEAEPAPRRSFSFSVPWRNVVRVGLVLGAALALVVWRPWVSSDNAFDNFDPEDGSVATAGKPHGGNEETDEDSASQVPTLRLAKVPKDAGVPFPGLVRTMTVEATDSVWVLIARKDGMVLFDGVLGPGQRTQNDIEDTLRVTLGRHWAAKILLNEQAVPVPKREARNMTFFLCTPSGIVPL